MTARTLAGLILAGFAAFGAWTWQSSLQNPEPLETLPGAEVQGVYIRQAAIVSPGPDGQPLYRMVAEEMSQALNSTTFGVSGVHLDYGGPGQGRWNLSADRGEVTLDWSDIRLSGNVSVEYLGAGNAATRLLTHALVLDALTHRASTTGRVVLQRGGGRIQATGMSVDLIAGTVALESGVNGHFAP